MSLRYTFFALFLLIINPLKIKGQNTDTTGLAALRTEAMTLRKNKRHAEALVLFQDAASRYGAAGDTLALAGCLLQSGICYSSLSDYDKSEATLLKAADLLRGDRFRTSELLIHIYISIGSLFHSRQQYDKALATFNNALTEAKMRLKPKAALFGNIYIGLAIANRRLERFPESEANLKSAMQAFEAAGAGMETTYMLELNMGTHYMLLSDHEKALVHFQKVENWLDTMPNISLSIQAEQLYLNLGALNSGNNNLQKALTCYYKADRMIQRRYGAYHEHKASSNNNIGNTLMRLDRFDEAMTYFEAALTLADSLWKAPSSLRVLIWSNIAVCRAKQKQEVEEAKAWEKALSEAKALGKHGDQAMICNMMANTRMEQKKHEEAVRLYQQSIASVIKWQGDKAASLCGLYTSLGNAMSKLNRFDEALICIEKSLSIQIKPGAQPYPSGYFPDTAFALIPATPFTLSSKARCLLGQWQNKSADALLDSAWVAVQQAIRLNDRFRQRYQHKSNENYEWLQKNRTCYALAAEIARQRYLTGRDVNGVEQAFQMADRNRAVLMQESVLSAEARLYAGIPSELTDTEARLSREIALYESQAFNATNKQSPASLHRDSLLFQLKHQQELLIERMERDYKHYFDLRYRTLSVTAIEIQQALNPNALFVEYLLDPDKSQLYIFTIDPQEGLNIAVTPLDDMLGAHVRELHDLMQSVWLGRNDNRKRFTQLCHTLYKQLLSPIEEYLVNRKQLVIIADGDLHFLPFELLLKTPVLKDFSELDYLLKRFEVTYQYSGALFVRHANGKKSAPHLHTSLTESGNGDMSARLLAFAPIFGKQDNPEAIALRNRSLVEAGMRPFSDGFFKPLPYSELETRTVAGLIGAHSVSLLLYEDANEAALKAELQKPYSMAHLASHSFANLSQPKFSGIACSQPLDTSETEDGILYVHEIYNLNIPIDLIVLSGCESGMGKLVNSEGLLGIGRAFAYAGVENIVYSLWKVNDKTGSELMIEFYKQMLTGKTYGAALRAAKLKMLENPATALPNLWSTFLLLGQ